MILKKKRERGVGRKTEEEGVGGGWVVGGGGVHVQPTTSFLGVKAHRFTRRFGQRGHQLYRVLVNDRLTEQTHLKDCYKKKLIKKYVIIKYKSKHKIQFDAIMCTILQKICTNNTYNILYYKKEENKMNAIQNS